jgi:hypothetical protein
MRREDELTKAGWERRFVSCEPRLSEMAEIYRSLGLDVLLEPLPPKEDQERGDCEEGGCTICFDTDKEKYRTIFTRPRS